MEKNLTFMGNGMLIDVTKKRTLTNAHLFYKGLSIIIDYERILHVYPDAVLNDNTIVPFEIYPYEDDIMVDYVSMDNCFHKADISEVLKRIDKLLEEE